MILFQVLLGNVGPCCFDAKGEIRRSSILKEKSTNVRYRGGAVRSSDETAERSWSKGVVSSSRIDMSTRKGRSI